MTCVDCIIEDPRWGSFGVDALAQAAVRATFAVLALGPDHFTLAILACDDARMAILNADFRGKPQPTNVLSWPSAERAALVPGHRPDLPTGDAADPLELGDMALAWETCQHEAAEQGKDPKAHVSHLIVHGVLHLLGYDHVNDADAELMEATEVQILARLGIADPY